VSAALDPRPGRPDAALPDDERDVLLSLEGVGKDFGHFTAVRDVSLKVRCGELKAIIGPNGAGKTTLFNMLSGELKPSRGRILYRGIDIAQRAAHALAHIGIGRSFQITNVFRGLSVLENVRIAVQSKRRFQYDFLSPARSLTGTMETADQILNAIGLARYRGALANSLSHGDQRRLEIGIVLATAPDLVLLDEPTAGMSRDEARQTMELIRGISVGRTVLFVEHNMEFVMGISQSVIVMQSGQVIAEGTAAEIRASAVVRRAYLGNLYE
jgi:branched-chain amino acid transport system ATP-binding protein